MTGRLSVRSGMFSAWNNSDHNVMTNVLHADGRGALPLNEITIPKALKKAGYYSKLIGKWHLGIQKENWPRNYGFDEFFGTPYTHGPDQGDQTALPDMQMFDNEKILGRLYRDIDIHEIHQTYSEKCLEFIDNHHNDTNPFLLIFTPDNTHLPLWPSKKWEGKSSRGPYGDTMEEADDIVGQILNRLKKLKIDDKTFVMFTSDNGPDMRDDLCFGESTVKCDITQGGSAGLLRGGKSTTWEGGIREPGIFWWPSKIPSGIVTQEYGVMTDLFATACDLAGVDLPKDRAIDGKSLLDVLIDNNKSPHEFLYHWRGNKLMAVTHGPFKVHFYSQGDHDWIEPYLEKYNPPIMFNLGTDPGERWPLDVNHPDYIRELPIITEAYEKHLNEVEIPKEGQLDVCDKSVALWKPDLPVPPSQNLSCCQDPCMTW